MTRKKLPQIELFSEPVTKRQLDAARKKIVLRQVWQEQKDGLLALFDEWRVLCDYPRARLTPKRKELLCSRLLSYNIGELRTALHAAASDPSTRGRNRNNTPYDDIINIFRTDERVDKYLKMAGHGRNIVALLPPDD